MATWSPGSAFDTDGQDDGRTSGARSQGGIGSGMDAGAGGANESKDGSSVLPPVTANVNAAPEEDSVSSQFVL